MKHTLRRILAILTGLLLLCGCGDKQLEPISLHLIGDSTMADKPDPDHNPERGWGQMLQGFFNDRVTVKNHAVNGRSTRSFIDEGKWKRVVDQIRPGDYVFIQFGHNDQKAYDPARYTNPYSAYRRNLEKMVRETRDKGAHPVLLSSIVRRNFNEEGTLVDTHGPYPFVARLVAQQNEVPFIDLQQMTEDLVSGLGPARSADLYMILKPGQYEKYPEGRNDNTHLNVHGATEVAGMTARSILELGLPLSAYLDPMVLKPRLLVVVGGHSYDTTEFVDMFRSMDEFRFDTIYHPHARSLLASDYIFSYDAVVFYDFIKELPMKDSSVYLNLAHYGMPMIFLHHSVCTFQEWEGYKELVGGKYVVDTYADEPSTASGYKHDLELDIKILDRNHPVTGRMDDFRIHDEGYSNLWYREGITPLLGTDHPDCSDIVAWVNHFDRSTCVYLMFGHDRQAYRNKAFRQLIRNSAAWLTGDSQRPPGFIQAGPTGNSSLPSCSSYRFPR